MRHVIEYLKRRHDIKALIGAGAEVGANVEAEALGSSSLHLQSGSIAARPTMGCLTWRMRVPAKLRC
jgi:hypothetical protein